MPPRNFLESNKFTLFYLQKVGKMGIFWTFFCNVPPRNFGPYAGPVQALLYHMSEILIKIWTKKEDIVLIMNSELQHEDEK